MPLKSSTKARLSYNKEEIRLGDNRPIYKSKTDLMEGRCALGVMNQHETRRIFDLR